MSVSTNAYICYGVKFDEDFEFPWDESDEDFEAWWERVDGCGPVPFTLVDYCSASVPMYILAAPLSVKMARRGYPLQIELPSAESLLHLTYWIREFQEFCIAWKIDIPDDSLGWWLSSYWDE